MHSKILNRICYGKNDRMLHQIQKLGFEAFVHAQLHPNKQDNPQLEAIRNQFVLGGDDPMQKKHVFQ